MLTSAEIGTEMLGLAIMAIDRQRQNQRVPRGIVPDLGRIDPMPGRNFACLQEKMNTSDGSAAAVFGPVAEGLDIMPAFGMRLHVEMVNEPRRCHGHGVQLSPDPDFRCLSNIKMPP